jgi:hypothetical protein
MGVGADAFLITIFGGGVKKVLAKPANALL